MDMTTMEFLPLRNIFILSSPPGHDSTSFFLYEEYLQQQDDQTHMGSTPLENEVNYKNAFKKLYGHSLWEVRLTVFEKWDYIIILLL